MRTKMFVLVIAVTLSCALVMNAQETRGSVIGQVVDASGAVVPGANVTAVNLETGVKQTTVANHEGAYEILYMLPGKYTISASATSFKTSVEEVQIRIHERTKVDLALEVGAVAEQVKITAEAPQLQTANANLGQVIDGRRIAELPLHDGTPYSVIFFTPGVADSGYGRLYQTPNNMDGASQGMSVNGTPMGTTSFMVDGTVNTQFAHGAGPMSSPPADLVEEFKLGRRTDSSGTGTGTQTRFLPTALAKQHRTTNTTIGARQRRVRSTFRRSMMAATVHFSVLDTTTSVMWKPTRLSTRCPTPKTSQGIFRICWL